MPCKAQTAGEDKELELTLLECGMHTVYLEHLPVYDEKTQKREHQESAPALDGGAIRHLV